MYWKTGAANISCVESHRSGNNGVYCHVCGCSYDRVLKVTSKKGHSCPTQMLDGFSPKLKLKIHQFRDHLIVQILKSHSLCCFYCITAQTRIQNSLARRRDKGKVKIRNIKKFWDPAFIFTAYFCLI